LRRTWTSNKNGVFWLKDCLPHDLDSARIMTFGYNAAAAFGRSTADVIDHAKDLLSSLVDKREDDKVTCLSTSMEHGAWLTADGRKQIDPSSSSPILLAELSSNRCSNHSPSIPIDR
jgi:hypothetical protein